ncbi:50S ribosomal protein L6 [Frankliniella fusca]|uniref:50S ribosomal protein L6 n=1 Tax=Frankliniella fusca TaxID=407009 RepID=A0AAE1H5S8_9NEOP|nr:50S ribosomal protein L6 [Frankliniella fusca]
MRPTEENATNREREKKKKDFLMPSKSRNRQSKVPRDPKVQIPWKSQIVAYEGVGISRLEGVFAPAQIPLKSLRYYR